MTPEDAAELQRAYHESRRDHIGRLPDLLGPFPEKPQEHG